MSLNAKGMPPEKSFKNQEVFLKQLFSVLKDFTAGPPFGRVSRCFFRLSLYSLRVKSFYAIRPQEERFFLRPPVDKQLF